MSTEPKTRTLRVVGEGDNKPVCLRDRILDAPDVKRTVVRCDVCRREIKVNINNHLIGPWPVCCGFNMVVLA